MRLGENIRDLRAEHRLSQSDLAEALEVSRQSVSKWETDGAVPDLDKLIKMSELFGVTLDELVGEARPAAADRAPAEGPVRRSPHYTAGVVLLGVFGLLTVLFFAMGGGPAGVILGLPFLACGVICLTARRRTGLWCAWAVFFLLDGYLRWATGLSWQTIFRTAQWTEHLNYTRLIAAWVQFLAVLLLLAATVWSFRGEKLPWDRKHLGVAAAGLAVFLALGAAQRGVLSNLLALAGEVVGPVLNAAYFCVWLLGDGLRLALLAALLAFAAALLRGGRRA